MGMQHVENMLRRFKGQAIDIKTMSGGVYEGVVTEITNDYVALTVKGEAGEQEQVFVLLHSIESVLPRGAA
jgi:ferredoxin-fold anticodon binding domain-containing protein